MNLPKLKRENVVVALSNCLISNEFTPRGTYTDIIINLIVKKKQSAVNPNHQK